jgi:hypothetical protein
MAHIVDIGQCAAADSSSCPKQRQPPSQCVLRWSALAAKGGILSLWARCSAMSPQSGTLCMQRSQLSPHQLAFS